MHILLTGAFGFVGLNLCRFLAAQAGVTVVAADLTVPDAAGLAFLGPFLQRVRILPIDVRDRAAVKTLVEQEKPTHIIHAAALTPTPEEEAANPTAIVDVNLNGTINVLEAAFSAKGRGLSTLQRFLLLSSSGVYGAPTPAAPPLQAEEGPLALTNLYAITKYSAELLAARYGQLPGMMAGMMPRMMPRMMTASVRLPPVYGPLERPSPSRPRISQVGALFAALADQRAVTVAGAHVARDWTHTDDINGAIWALLAAPRWRYAVYNVSYGAALSFGEVVATFVKHGLQARWVDDPAAAEIALPSDLARLPLDIGRLQSDSDFVPRVSFAEGVARLLAAKK